MLRSVAGRLARLPRQVAAATGRWWKRYSCSMRGHRFLRTVFANWYDEPEPTFYVAEWCLQCDEERQPIVRRPWS